MAGEEVVVILSLILISFPLIAFFARRSRFRAYQKLFEIATAYGLTLRRSRSGAGAEPEARGRVGGRPVLADYNSGGKYSGPSVSLSVGHRFPVAAPVLLLGTLRNSRAWGGRRWTRHPLTGDPDGPLIMSKDAVTVEALLRALTEQGMGVLAQWTQEQDFRIGCIEGGEISLTLEVDKPMVPNAVPLIEELLALASFLEDAAEPGSVDYKELGSGGGLLMNVLLLGLSLMLVVVGIGGFFVSPVLGLAIVWGASLTAMFSPSRAERKLMARSRFQQRKRASS